MDDHIGPDIVNTLTESTIDAVEDHGVLKRTLDRVTDRAAEVLRQIFELGIDMDDVAHARSTDHRAFYRRSETATEALGRKSTAVTAG